MVSLHPAGSEDEPLELPDEELLDDELEEELDEDELEELDCPKRVRTENPVVVQVTEFLLALTVHPVSAFQLDPSHRYITSDDSVILVISDCEYAMVTVIADENDVVAVVGEVSAFASYT